MQTSLELCSVCALHCHTQALPVLCPALFQKEGVRGKIQKPRSKSSDSFSTITKLGMINEAWSLLACQLQRKKSNHFSCFRFFPRCMRRELGTLGIVCWVYPFLQSEAVVPSFCSKNAEKRPCLHDLVSYHDSVHVSPNSALMYLSVYLEMLYWSEWLWFQLYRNITGTRFEPLAAFFQTFLSAL